MFSFPDAARCLSTSVVFPDPGRFAAGASIDSRTLKEGQMFVALRGEKQDGHLYLEAAFARGASGALVEKKIFESLAGPLPGRTGLLKNILPVPDPAGALARLAVWHRRRMKAVTVGITGSAGKTTTKEFLSYLLRTRCPVLANPGNLNNHLGLPLTLLGLDEGHGFCVAELGANHRGEIRFLAEILGPDAGVLTQVCPAHLEGFGSMDAIYDTKLELFESLKPGSLAVLPDSDAILLEKTGRMDLKFVRVGKTRKADYRVSGAAVRDGFVHFTVNGKYPFAFPGLASFYADNAALAVAMADALGISLASMPSVWDDLVLPPGRFTSLTIGGDIRVIYDGYNANPRSFEKALDAFAGLASSGRKVLVFADMAELGEREKYYHEALGRRIADFGFDFTVAYGPRALDAIAALKKEAGADSAAYFETRAEASDFLNGFLRPGDCVMMKASRSMKIEEVLASLKKNREGGRVLSGG